MLALARSRAGPLVRADVGRLPLRPESLDAVVAVAVLEFVADPAAAVGEMCRVTRRGGRVVVGALNPHSAWGVARWRRLRRPPWTAARFLDRKALRRLGRPHGPTTLHSALFLPGPLPPLGLLGPLAEALGALLPGLGAFQVLVIDRR